MINTQSFFDESSADAHDDFDLNDAYDPLGLGGSLDEPAEAPDFDFFSGANLEKRPGWLQGHCGA